MTDTNKLVLCVVNIIVTFSKYICPLGIQPLEATLFKFPYQLHHTLFITLSRITFGMTCIDQSLPFRCIGCVNMFEISTSLISPCHDIFGVFVTISFYLHISSEGVHMSAHSI